LSKNARISLQPRPGIGPARAVTLAILAACVLASCATTTDETAAAVPAAAPHPKAMAQFIEDGDAALKAGDYEAARSLFGRVAAFRPEDSRARLGLAEVHLATGNLEQADAGFEALTEEAAVRPQALQGKGITLLRMNRGDEAFEFLSPAVDEDRSLWRAWNALGHVYDMRRDWPKAEGAYQAALAANPRSEAVYNNMGMSLLMQGRHHEAAAAFAEALNIRRDLVEAEMNLRIALALQGRYTEAKAGVSEQRLSEVLNNLGYIAILRGDYDRATAFLSQAMETSPRFNETAWRNIQYLETLKEKGDELPTKTPPAE
jgi:Flp pilus assembly protein TadD